jgi:hypothetical protein
VISLRSRRPLALVAALLLVAGCGTAPTRVPASAASGPSATIDPTASEPSTSAAASATTTASPDNAAVYAQIETDVQALRQLAAKTPVEPHLVDQAGMTKVIEDELAATPASATQASEASLRAVGLLPPGASLEALQRQMLTSQVAGLYDPTAKTLYVLSKQGALGPVERVTFAHEFDHALQDQNFGLGNLKVDQVGEGDRDLAHLSLPEGDATLLMSFWARQHLSPADTLRLLAESSDPQQVQLLNSLPAILRETLLFPYTTGLSFVTALQASGGWAAVDAAYARPPDSTEQLLHPEKYANHEAVLPIDVPADLAKRLGKGWSVPLVDSLGEFQLRVWLEQVGGASSADATAAAAGWGGDRLLYATGPNGAWGVALLTRWDTAQDAREFGTAAGTAVAHLDGATATIDAGDSGRFSIFVASDEASVSRLAGALGLAG